MLLTADLTLDVNKSFDAIISVWLSHTHRKHRIHRHLLLPPFAAITVHCSCMYWSNENPCVRVWLLFWKYFDWVRFLWMAFHYYEGGLSGELLTSKKINFRFFFVVEKILGKNYMTKIHKFRMDKRIWNANLILIIFFHLSNSYLHTGKMYFTIVCSKLFDVAI